MERFTALVLAGRRGAAADPLAAASGAPHRALLDVCGVPMLVRVVRTLRASESVGRIVVSIGEPEALEHEPELAGLLAQGELASHRSRESPSRSVLDALDQHGRDGPVLVTTADHPLLTPAVIEHFTGAARALRADLVVGTVAGEVVRARYPDAVRTWLRLRDGGWTGANLFAFCTPEARRAAEFWVRAEQFRKQPWRLASAFGWGTLLLFVLRRLDLRDAFERISRAMGARVEALALPFAEAAIDVDRPADLALASRILAGAETGQGSGGRPL